MADETTTTATEQAITATRPVETAQATEAKAAEPTQAKAAEPTQAKAAEPTQATETRGAETGEAKAAGTTAEPVSRKQPVDYAKALSEASLPEGMTLDPAAVKLGTDLFARHDISAEAARDLVSLYAQQQKAGADGNARAFADQVDGWKAAAEKGSTAEERGTARDALLRIFDKEEIALLEHFGVTNRLGFIKALAKVGQAIRDDPLVRGNAGGANGSRDARSLFPNSNMNP